MQLVSSLEDMVQRKAGSESFLVLAKEQERRYDWDGAVEPYKRALDLIQWHTFYGTLQ